MFFHRVSLWLRTMKRRSALGLCGLENSQMSISRQWFCLCGLALCGLFWVGCDSKPEKTQLRVFIADALARPFDSVRRAFEQ